MGRTVAELEATLSTDELAHWLAFDRGSPIGDERADYLHAQLCALVAGAAGVKKRGGGDFVMKDFILFVPREFEKAEAFLRRRFGHLVKRKES